MRTSKTLRLVAATAVAAGTLTTVAGVAASPAQAATCKHVTSTVQDIGIYNAPTGGQLVGRFIGNESFSAYAQDDGRYRVHFTYADGSLYQGWVSASDAYVAAGGWCADSSPSY